MLTPGLTVADVGCDHGFVSIYLKQSGRCEHIYACDVRPGPLSRAKEHIEAAGLSDSIKTVLSDGLKTLPEEGIESLIIAGMGGKLTIRILSDSPEKVRGLKEMVLEPQSEVWLVRAYLREIGFSITKEDMVLEDGKFYPVIYAENKKAVQKELPNQEILDQYGPCLISSKHPVLVQYLLHRIEADTVLIQGIPDGEDAPRRAVERKKELQVHIQKMKRLLAYLKGEDCHEMQ